MVPLFKSPTIYHTKKTFATKIPAKHQKCRKAEGKDERKSKKDEVSGEECVMVKPERNKKRIKKDNELKFIVNLNNLVHEMVKNHACRKMEQINKLHSFIFKPSNCTSCMERKKEINNNKIDHQKRHYSMSAIKKKISPNNIPKKKESNQMKVPSKTETIYLPFLIEKFSEKKSNAMTIKDPCEITKGGIIPLYLLVKSSSRKSKTSTTMKKHFQYRVGTNHAFVPLENTADSPAPDPQKYVISSTKSTDSFFSNKYPLVSMDTETSKANKPKSEVKFRLQESFMKATEDKTRDYKPRRDLEFNAMLAELVRKVLTPLLQKEQLKYSEVKKGKYRNFIRI